MAQWQKWFDARWDHTPITARGHSETKRHPTNSKKRSYKDQFELDGMEQKITEAEALVVKLTERCADPEVLSQPAKLGDVSKELAAAQKTVETLYARWAELEQPFKEKP